MVAFRIAFDICIWQKCHRPGSHGSSDLKTRRVTFVTYTKLAAHLDTTWLCRLPAHSQAYSTVAICVDACRGLCSLLREERNPPRTFVAFGFETGEPQTQSSMGLG